MHLSRRELLGSIGVGLAVGAARCARPGEAGPPPPTQTAALKNAAGDVDWRAVRDLFPLSRDWTHLASFLLVSHPAPVAAAIERFRARIDADPVWLEEAAFGHGGERPFAAIKESLAAYIGGRPDEICLTPNTTTALAMAFHGLRIRADQSILTTTDDHYSQHESIRFAAERAKCAVRKIALYDRPADANAGEMVARIAKAIDAKTRAVAMTWVHSSTGVKTPVAAIAEVVARANRGRAPADRCLLIVDGVHGFANQDVDVARLGCDFFATGTHKWLFAPRGTGFLWGRRDVWPELRPTIPTFDPDAMEPWGAWMNDAPLPPTKAAFVSPGGFLAFENFLAIPAAIELHGTIGRAAIARRIADLNGAFRAGAATIPNVTLHTPPDPDLSGGISCFEVKGVTPEAVATKLAAKRIRTNSSPYKTSYARVAAGVMNSPEDVDTVLREIRALV